MLIASRASAAGDDEAMKASTVTVDKPASIVDTTSPATVDQVLVVASPEIGALVTSPLTISGNVTSGEVGYRVLGAGSLLVEGRLAAGSDGSFSTTVEFTNTCCVELTLEVFDPEPGGLAVSIPLTYPEPG